MSDKQENKFKKEPSNDWLLDLNKYRIKEPINGAGMSCKGPYYSDDGEDGVINYLFDYINSKNKFAVDIGAYCGLGGSNVRYIVDKYDWGSIELDGANNFVQHGGVWGPKCHERVESNTWITPDNICKLLEDRKCPKEFDLLDIDIDSMDWYVLESILNGGYKPSVMILEYNPVFLHNEPYIINYNDNYTKDSTSNYGASARAFELLGNKFDYTLVHIFADIEKELYCNNMILLHNDFITDKMDIKTIEELHFKNWVEPCKRNNARHCPDWVREKVFKVGTFKPIHQLMK